MSHPTQSARLVRSKNDRMIGGVAGGMAAHLNVDTAWIRLAWLAVLFLGPGVILYIIAWIAIPEGYTEMPADTRPSGAGDTGRIIVGGLLVLGGIALLANRYVPWMRDLWLPAFLIAVGTGVIIYSVKK
jgi:phage shock protein PspC (stress-responsive transcriptional regulator)